MKIMSLRNGNDLVNNMSCGLVVYRITTIPSWHNFHIKETETQSDILYLFHRMNTKSSIFTRGVKMQVLVFVSEIKLDLTLNNQIFCFFYDFIYSN